MDAANANRAYHLKWIKWKGNKCAIITQNENGPCPLIAVMNVLLLRGRVRLPSMMELITPSQVMEYLGDCILSSLPRNVSEDEQLNYEQNMHDAIAILPKLQTGLDVNVKFTAITHFEYTPELIVFDLLHIPLYHGWLIDPEMSDIAKAVGNCSYNQLVDKVITNKSAEQELVAEALIAEQFLEKTASQLTYHGLSQLISNIKEGELSVLFRNNHFITLYKHKKELYQLVTDQGFLTESNVVWETLNNIENDGQFVDSDFNLVPPKTIPPVNSQQQVDQDYLIALSLQEEAKKESETEKEWENFKVEAGMEGLSDEELARRLQLEEEKRYQKLQQQQQQQAKQAAKSNSPQHQKQQSPSESQRRRTNSVSSSPTRKNERKDDENSNGRSGKQKSVVSN
ncbi:hypothetical protein B4U79_03794 [Dinothrombium tinctorium]|uniref:Ubiquitin carboxyl-terminal hydrolase n=1 Tax=Dinothrombium tinctorium TaxID=1965070 RepID=A0A3S3PIF8_9ACAR|nr:hypothetical protein B4U79_03794 [Dinothrombium tinctorium]